MLAKYLRAEGLKFELPVSEKVILGFIHWLAFKRGLKAGSISGYLSGIKKLHIIKGAEEPKIRTELVNMVLEGKKNMDAAARLSGPNSERQPVTLDIMKLLKAQLNTWQASPWDRQTAWLVCTLLFHSACRGGELLCKSNKVFDPAVDLLRKDITLTDKQGTGKSTLQLRIKTPKESKDNRAVIVDILESGSAICPVRAYKKWNLMAANMDRNSPAFCWENGKPVTARAMNTIIKGRLDQYIPGHGISVHSFRTGAASMMAELGYGEDDIKAVGRWSSQAFENYLKLPRTKRIQTLRKMQYNHSWNNQ